MASLRRFCSISPEIRCLTMKSPMDFLRLVTLLFIAPLFRKRIGENFLVDQVGVSADAAQVARRPFDAGLEHAVIARIDVDLGFDVAIGMGKLDSSPRRIKTSRGSRRH